MSVEEPGAPVRLAVPAEPGSISIVRAVAASVASRMAVSYEGVDDLRIAVAEAVTLLLTDHAGGTRLQVDLEPAAHELRLLVWIEGTTATATDVGDALAWRVIDGLADQATETSVDGCPAIELRMWTVTR